MAKYRIVESVGSARQPVHDYDDLEIHHPSKHGHERGRHYQQIEGRQQEILTSGGEVVRSREGHVFVSKDFILLDDRTGTKEGLAVPAPAAGYVKVDQRNGLVRIYDSLTDGEMIAQVRHMDLRNAGLKDGDHVEYGQPMGLQAGMGGGNPGKYPTHVHIDFNANQLDKFRQYINDIDAGVVAIHAPANKKAGEQDHEDASVRHAQRLLNKLGYRDENGHRLEVDGDFAGHTKAAVYAFQHAHGLPQVDHVGPKTREALRNAEHSPSPVDPIHPDHALYRQTLGAVHRLDHEHHRAPDASSDRLAASLTRLAKDNGLTRVDHVVLSIDTGQVKQGENVFVVQGALDDPARRTAHMKTQLAIDTPVVESFRQLEQVNAQQREQALQVVPAQHMQQAHAEYREGPRMVPAH